MDVTLRAPLEVMVKVPPVIGIYMLLIVRVAALGSRIVAPPPAAPRYPTLPRLFLKVPAWVTERDPPSPTTIVPATVTAPVVDAIVTLLPATPTLAKGDVVNGFGAAADKDVYWLLTVPDTVTVLPV